MKNLKTVASLSKDAIHPKIVAIIQARMGSTRLPGKVMMEIEGRPMLWHVVRRTKLARCIDEIVVATSHSKNDDPIEHFCRAEGIPCYRGSEHDVLDRYYRAAKEFNADLILRVTADCPLIDPLIIEKIAADFQRARQDSGCEYASNTLRYTYPDGMDAELFSMAALERAWEEAKKPSEREHVTPYLRLSHQFKTKSVENAQDLSPKNYHWSVDRKEDLDFVRQIFKKLGSKTEFGLKEILFTMENHPELSQINASQVVNEGYFTSLYQEAATGAAPKRNVSESMKWFSRSKKTIPGCAQTFSKSYLQFVQGVSPLFLQKGKGCTVWDVDGNEYVDYVQGLLPNILGYSHPEVNAAAAKQVEEGHSFSLAHPIEVVLAEKLTQIIPCAEMVRFGKNGSDATSGAIRAARAFTGRERVAVCGYHGWQDWYIGSTTRNLGVPKGVQALTHTFAYNDPAALETLLSKYKNEFAAVILEPMNFIEPAPNFLNDVHAIAKKHGTLLIFDEVCSGFMFGLGGLQKQFGVIPDLACFGKAMGNGFPISCIVGRRDVMRLFEEIFFSFTFAGEVASMAAALKVIDILENTDALQTIEYQGRVLQNGFNALSKEAGLHEMIQSVARPQWALLKFKDKQGQDSILVRSLFQQEATKRGILLLVTHNMTAAHTSLSTEKTLEAYASIFKTLSHWLSDPNPEKYLEGEKIRPVFKVR